MSRWITVVVTMGLSVTALELIDELDELRPELIRSPWVVIQTSLAEIKKNDR